MQIIDHLKWRYATKKFDATKQLSPNKLNVLKEAFNLTATSYGLQPIKLVVISDKTAQAKLVKHSMDQQQVVQASHLLVFCIETQIDTEFIHSYFRRVKNIRNTPDHILVPFEDFLVDKFNKKTLNEIEQWATKQAYLAMGNLLTVCAAENIDACPMEGFNPEAYDSILNLKQYNLKSVLAMPVGCRADDDIFADFKKVRKPIEDIIIDYKT